MRFSDKDKAYWKIVGGLVNNRLSDQEAISALVNAGISADSESAKTTISFIKNDIAQQKINRASGIV